MSLLICFQFGCYATTWGSWGAITYECAVLSISGNSNQITGYDVCDTGITLANAATFVVFDALYTLNGTMIFNGGTLAAGRDIIFGGNTSFSNAGSIAAQGWQISLPQEVTTFTMPAMTLGQIKLVLNSNLILSGATTFTGACAVQGNGYTIDCTNGSFSIAAGGALALNNVNLINVSATSLSCVDNTATCSFINGSCSLLTSFTFNRGNFVVLGDWAISGTTIFTYASPQQLSLAKQASLLFDQGITFSYAPSSGSKTLINFADATASLYFRNATLQVASTGLQLTKGTLVFEGSCPVISRGMSSANGIVLGDGSSVSNNISLSILAGSGPYVIAGYLVNNNV